MSTSKERIARRSRAKDKLDKITKGNMQVDDGIDAVTATEKEEVKLRARIDQLDPLIARDRARGADLG